MIPPKDALEYNKELERYHLDYLSLKFYYEEYVTNNGFDGEAQILGNEAINAKRIYKSYMLYGRKFNLLTETQINNLLNT